MVPSLKARAKAKEAEVGMNLVQAGSSKHPIGFIDCVIVCVFFFLGLRLCENHCWLSH